MSTYQLLLKLDDTNLSKYYDQFKFNSENCGFDVYLPNDVTFLPFETIYVNMGIKCEMKKFSDHDLIFNPINVSYLLYARSSLSKTGLILLNSVGIIDNSYRGNIIAALKYIPEKGSLNECTVKAGTRLVQLCTTCLSPIHMKYTNTLSSSNRGEGGFGSTGK